MYPSRLFQSLIGRLKTTGDIQVWPTWEMFQSLIGRLKTDGNDGDMGAEAHSFNPS